MDSVIYGQIEEDDEFLLISTASLTVQSPLPFNSTLSYTTHPQAVYTSKLLDYKNIPEP